MVTTYHVSGRDYEAMHGDLMKQGWKEVAVTVLGLQPGQVPEIVVDMTRKSRGIFNEKTFEDMRLVIR